MVAKLLTETKIRNTKPDPSKKEQLLHDGDGLYLRFVRSESKRNTKLHNTTWLLRFTDPVRKTQTRTGLGKYPDISLAEARELAQEKRLDLAKGSRPARETVTLAAAVERWLEECKAGTVTEAHQHDIRRSLEMHVLPSLGQRPLEDIKTHELKAALEPLVSKGSLEQVKRICGRLNEVGVYFQLLELADRNPFANSSRLFQKPIRKHLPAIRSEKLSELFVEVENSRIHIPTLALFEFSLQVVARPGECAGCKWDEIDFDRRIWTIPGERIKQPGKARMIEIPPHRVPLSDQVCRLLERMQGLSGNQPHVFPHRSDASKHISSQTVNNALKNLGYKDKLVSHGFRTIMSTYLNEQGESPDAIEAALAHTQRNKVRAAYNRTDYLEVRAPLMQRWSDFLEEQAVAVNAKLFILNNRR